jgi:hypothetical protein
MGNGVLGRKGNSIITRLTNPEDATVERKTSSDYRDVSDSGFGIETRTLFH